ncbi:UNVERIFIED_CONTAM: hypothetical protein Sradi_6014000 [Sesamum radiatum]|uniref:Uncharacterized protein n=1 Tax=Sesamum radiatum TaxID=300843 RepID=A0AAW2KHN9_SESRA
MGRFAKPNSQDTCTKLLHGARPSGGDISTLRPPFVAIRPLVSGCLDEIFALERSHQATLRLCPRICEVGGETSNGHNFA